VVQKAGILQMTIIREFSSNFIKIKRTPIILLHLLLPFVVTTLFLVYYVFAGYHIIPDIRLFFVILQICYPIFVSIVVPILINLDRDINNIQNALGLVESRKSVYLGKLFFLMFLFAISIILYELWFYVGVNLILDISIIHLGSYLAVFHIFLFSNLFLYLLHILIAFKFGSSISVLTGISGTILAGFFENAIGDKIWPIIPWEWGVRFLKIYFYSSSQSFYPGFICLIIVTSIILVLSTLWYSRWEGKVLQE
jgi:ABC-2 type transport system permease protein